MHKNIKTILLVEDNAITAMSESELLKNAGYDVIHVLNGIKAINRVKTATIDLILMDIDLGDGMDGTETATEILRNHDIPVVFLSSHKSKEIVDKTEKISSYGYVVKDTGGPVLLASIKMAFKLYESHKILKLKETAMRESEFILNEAQSLSHIGCWNWEMATGALTWSTEIFRIFGADPSTFEVSAENFEKNIHPEDLEPFIMARTKMLENNSDAEMEHRIVRPDGEIRFVIERAKVARDSGGKTLRVFGTVQDITERKKSDEKIIKSEGKYRRLYESMMDAFVGVDIHGAIKEWNNAYQNLVGYSDDELLTLSYKDITPEKWRIIEEEIHMDQVMKRGYSDIYEKEYIRKDGSIIPIELRVLLIRDDKGEPERMWAIVRDILKRKEMEEKSRWNEERYRKFVNSVTDYIYSVELESGRQVSTSHGPGCVAVTGYTSEEYESDPNLWLKMVYDEDKPAVAELAVRVISGVKVEPLEHRIVHKNGSIRWVVNTPVIINDSEGILAGYDGLISDITARKDAALELEKSLKEKGILLMELQHRVKNNLNVIFNLLDLELHKLSDEKSRSVFINAMSRIKSMSKIYEQIYKSSNLNIINLCKYIDDFVRSIYDMYAIDCDNTSMSLKLPDIKLDLKRAIPLGLILNELVSNALKYAYPIGKKGEIRVELLESPNSIELIVSDDGVGIPEGFDPYTTESLGFLLVNMLSEQIEGSMDVKSSASNGTTVRIKFKV